MANRASRIERFQPSDVVLRLPLTACENLVISGLSAAQMRIAFVLIALCHQASGRSFIIEKNRLEQLSAVTLNTVEKLLAPLMNARIDADGHELHGEFVFENIAYDPGEKGKKVGRVRATMSIAMGHFLAFGRNRLVEFPADEMRLYSTMGAIILRIRLGAIFAGHKTGAGASIRISGRDVSAIFGSYGRTAVIKRLSAKTGETVERVALSRVSAMLVEPAIDEINENCRSMSLKSTSLLDGRNAVAILIDAKRLQPKTTAPKPAPRATRPIVRGRPTRAVVKPQNS